MENIVNKINEIRNKVMTCNGKKHYSELTVLDFKHTYMSEYDYDFYFKNVDQRIHWKDDYLQKQNLKKVLCEDGEIKIISL